MLFLYERVSSPIQANHVGVITNQVTTVRQPGYKDIAHGGRDLTCAPDDDIVMRRVFYQRASPPDTSV
jgi:hypothetical protein